MTDHLHNHVGDPLPTNHRVCTRCIYDDRVPSISFDEAGVCNYCHQVDDMKAMFGTGTEQGKLKLENTIDRIKFEGRGKRYDCVMGVSGGTDSSYMLWLAKEYGLRPLAVHYDNTWNSAIATQNLFKVLKALDIDLVTHVMDNKEIDDIHRSFVLANVPELEAPTDLGAAEYVYRAAAKAGVKYILEGHSFVTEGISPLGNNYFDGRYIQSVHARYGRMPMRTFPLMTFSRFMYWTAISKIKKIRPFWYLDYSKEAARSMLQANFDWVYYGGHHLENRMSSFFHSVYLPGKFGGDFRNNTLAALAREGKMSRRDAWAEYNLPPHIEEDIVTYFNKRMGFTATQFDEIMAGPKRTWHEFPTYKKRFERLRPLFHALAKAELVPMSFYLKYCFPIEGPA
jgi:N-acetyl sugar amidotransferase